MDAERHLLRRLWADMDQEYLRGLLESVEGVAGWSWKPADAARILRDFRVFGLMEGDTLHSFLAFQEIPAGLEICAVATRPESTNRGYGSLLFRHLKKLLMDEKNHEVWLEVSELNSPALSMYRSQGFRVVGQRPHYYADGGSALLMTYSDESLASPA